MVIFQPKQQVKRDVHAKRSKTPNSKFKTMSPCGHKARRTSKSVAGPYHLLNVTYDRGRGKHSLEFFKRSVRGKALDQFFSAGITDFGFH
jgi:hypothetical protein